MANSEQVENTQAVIGGDASFWSFDSNTGFDLTHPPAPGVSLDTPTVTVKTTSVPIIIDPAKSALVVVDMQNFFLSSALGKTRGKGHEALDELVDHAIPACRKAGIQIIWLNWGLTDEDLRTIPPAVSRAFGFEATVGGSRVPVDKFGQVRKAASDFDILKLAGLGSDCGTVRDPATGSDIDAGRALMRDTWNSGLHPPLDSLYEEGLKLARKADVWMHKNRMSGLWGETGPCEQFLQAEGIRTLFFTGVNTDQCVGGTLTDAFSKGYDCVLLTDGAATSSPDFAQHCFEYNAARTFGFATTCAALHEGANAMHSPVGV